MRHTLNTIEREFIGGGETGYTQRRYTPQVLTLDDSPTNPDLCGKETLESNITFSYMDVVGIQPDDNDHIVNNCEV